MQDYSKGKMFLAAERGHIETDWFRSYATFNVGSYQHENKTAFGPLYILNDETLAAGKSVRLVAAADSYIVVLPVVGVLTFKHDDAGIVQAGEVISFSLKKGESIELSNPFEAELVNYIQLWCHSEVEATSKPVLFSFQIDMNQNRLIRLLKPEESADAKQLPFMMFMGKFGGRKEIVYTVSKKCNGLFVFVLQGAFEVQYRLLEARDGLALWNVDETEIEALSNDAILLLVELNSPMNDCERAT